MKAHVVENGKVINTIVVDSLADAPNLIDGEVGGIGWSVVNGTLIPPPEPVLTVEQKSSIARDKRNFLLLESDWTQGKDVLDSISAKWAPYRQALRDIPQQPGFPDNIQWPTKPE